MYGFHTTMLALKKCLRMYRCGELGKKEFVHIVTLMLKAMNLNDLVRKFDNDAEKARAVVENLVENYFTMKNEPRITVVKLTKLVKKLRNTTQK